VVDAVSVVPSGTALQSASVGTATAVCCTVAVNVWGWPVRFVAAASSRTRYCSHVFVVVSGTSWPADCPGAPTVVRSTTAPALSVRLATVSVPVPAPADVTVTMQVPAALVVHCVGGDAVPAPVHV
jgi:hypothetical protein